MLYSYAECNFPLYLVLRYTYCNIYDADEEGLLVSALLISAAVSVTKLEKLKGVYVET